MLRLLIRHEQNSCIGPSIFGFREATGSPDTGAYLSVKRTKEDNREGSLASLEPVYVVVANTESTVHGAGESGCCSGRCIERGCLGQHRLEQKPANTDTQGGWG